MPVLTTHTSPPATVYDPVWYSLPKSYWMETGKASRCQFQDCGTLFSFFQSKINCHRCGIVLCKSCIASRAMEGLFSNDEVPVCPRCAMVIDAVVQRKHRQKAGTVHSPVVVPASGLSAAAAAASSSLDPPLRSPSPSSGVSAFPAALTAITNAAAAVLMPTHSVGEWRAASGDGGNDATRSRERDLEQQHDTLRQLLAEEIERGAIRQASYKNDIEALVNEKTALLKQVDILRRRAAAADDLGDTDFTVNPDKPLDGLVNGSAEAHMKPEDIKKERRLLKKSVNQLSHLLKREKAKREEVEQRLRDFSMEMQTTGGSVCGGGGAGSPTSSTAGQSVGTPVLTAGSRRGAEMDQRGNEEAAGSVSPDPKAQTTTTIAANGEGSSDRRGVTPSWTSMETPHIPLTGPTGGTPGRWARSATPEEQEAQLSRWAEELFEKEELMRKMFECIQTRENQLRSLTDSLRRRSAQLIDLHATLFREERMVILGEEMDEVHIGVGGDVSGSAVTA